MTIRWYKYKYDCFLARKMREKKYNYFIWKLFPFGIIEDIRG